MTGGASTRTPATPEQVSGFAGWFTELQSNVGRVVKGKETEIAMALVGLFAEGHLLLQDVPGTGKTLLAKSIAGSIDGSFSRIQFTPDLLPSDVTGGLVYHQGESRFELHRGPVFANVVLADEINRASPKTQSALLEVMEERQVTLGNDTHPVSRPFLVIATQNPIEQAGTYRLPEAQLDRFVMRLSLGYPAADDEVDILASPDPSSAIASLAPVLPIDGVRDLITIADAVHVDRQINRYIVSLANATRVLPDVRLGVSPRGSRAVLASAKALAASQGREYVKADDVKSVAIHVMAHRLVLTPDAELDRVDQRDLIRVVVDSVPVPTVRT